MLLTSKDYSDTFDVTPCAMAGVTKEGGEWRADSEDYLTKHWWVERFGETHKDHDTLKT